MKNRIVCTESGTRTHTAGKGQGILSPQCLPFHHFCNSASPRFPRNDLSWIFSRDVHCDANLQKTSLVSKFYPIFISLSLYK